jgi:hypothetical protein
VKSIVTYGAQTREFSRNLESILMSIEMDFLRSGEILEVKKKIIDIL